MRQADLLRSEIIDVMPFDKFEWTSRSITPECDVGSVSPGHSLMRNNDNIDNMHPTDIIPNGQSIESRSSFGRSSVDGISESFEDMMKQ